MQRNIFAERLDEALNKMGVSEEELSENTRIPVIVLKKWRAGKHTPRYKDIQIVAGKLNINKLYLLGRKVAIEKERASCKKW